MMLKTKHLALFMFVTCSPGLFAISTFQGGNTVDFGALAGNIGLNLPGYLDSTSVVAPVVTNTSLTSSSYSGQNVVTFGALSVTTSSPAPSYGAVTVAPVLGSSTASNVVTFAPLLTASNVVSYGAVVMGGTSVSTGVVTIGSDAYFASLTGATYNPNYNSIFSSSLTGPNNQAPGGVPEPTTLALVGIGSLGLGLLRRR